MKLSYLQGLQTVLGYRSEGKLYKAEKMEEKLWGLFKTLSVEQCKELAPSILKLNKKVQPSADTFYA